MPCGDGLKCVNVVPPDVPPSDYAGWVGPWHACLLWDEDDRTLPKCARYNDNQENPIALGYWKADGTFQSCKKDHFVS